MSEDQKNEEDEILSEIESNEQHEASVGHADAAPVGPDEASNPVGFAEARSPQDASTHESVRPRVITDPGSPSQMEINEHCITHVPYRAWCRFCVCGRGNEDAHHRIRREAKAAAIPTVSAD